MIIRSLHLVGVLVALILLLAGCIPAGFVPSSTAAPTSSPSPPDAPETSVSTRVIREVTVCPQVEVVRVQACIDVNENGCCESGEAPLPGVTVRISVDGRSVSEATDQAGEARVETCRGRCECRIQSVDTEPPAAYRKADRPAGCSSSADAFIPRTASSTGQSISTHAPIGTPGFWPTGMPPPTRGPTAIKTARPGDEVTCLQEGGEWFQQRVGIPYWGCYGGHSTDASRPCSDESECQGWCQANLTRERALELATNRPAGEPLLMTGTCSGSRWPKGNDIAAEVLDGQLVAYEMREYE
jgi:hypothetical protein